MITGKKGRKEDDWALLFGKSLQSTEANSEAEHLFELTISHWEDVKFEELPGWIIWGSSKDMGSRKYNGCLGSQRKTTWPTHTKTLWDLLDCTSISLNKSLWKENRWKPVKQRTFNVSNLSAYTRKDSKQCLHLKTCSSAKVKKDQVDDLQRNSVQKTSLNKTPLKSVATVKT